MAEKPTYEQLEQKVVELEKDLVEQKLFEKSSLESKTLLRVIMDNAPALISAKDLKGNVIMTNRKFEVLDGPSPEEFIGKNVYDLFPFEIADALWKNDLAAIEAESPVESEETVAHKDKEIHIYHTVKFPLYEVEGKAFGTCAISVDITERKQMEEELKRHRDRLEELVNERTVEIEKALKEIKTLRGILPLCSYCKKIRDDKGFWEQVDVYIYKHSQADISHSICPECMKEHYPELDIED